MRRSALIDAVKSNAAAAPQTRAVYDIVLARLRLPRSIDAELKKLAADEGISFNALVASMIEAGLEDRGRRSFSDMAPWFPDYLKRRAQSTPEVPSDPDFD